MEREERMRQTKEREGRSAGSREKAKEGETQGSRKRR